MRSLCIALVLIAGAANAIESRSRMRSGARGNVDIPPALQHDLTRTSELPACSADQNCVLDVYATSTVVVGVTGSGTAVTINNATANGFQTAPMYSYGTTGTVYAAKDITDATAPFIAGADARTILGENYWSSDLTVMCAGAPTTGATASPVLLGHGDSLVDGFFMQAAATSLQCRYQSSGVSSANTVTISSPFSEWSAFSCSKTGTTSTARVNGTETSGAITQAANAGADDNLYFFRHEAAGNAARGPLYRCRFYNTALSSTTKALREAQMLKGLAVRPADTYVTTTRASAASDYYPSGFVHWSGDNVRIPHATKGLQSFAAVTNSLLHRRLFSVGGWTASNVTFAATTGIDGVASSATRITSTAANGTALQALVLASASRTFSVDIKRVTGTGNIDITRDNGTTWATLNTSNCFDVATGATGTAINSSTWVRCRLNSTLANPTVGLRLVTSGDAVDVDYAQDEAGAVAMPRCDHPTQTAAAACAADTHTVPTTGWPTTSGEVSIIYTPASATAPSSANGLIDTRTGATAGGILIYRDTLDRVLLRLYDASANVCSATTAALTWTAGTAKTIEARWTPTTCALFVDGVSAATGAASGSPAAYDTAANIGGAFSGTADVANGWLRSLCVGRQGACP